MSRSTITVRIRQTVRYVNASDGVRLAWAESGSGPTPVRAATWLTHLEHDLDSPVWRHWLAFLSDHFRLVRYDERGCRMSDWNIADLSLDRRVADNTSRWRRFQAAVLDFAGGRPASLPDSAFAALSKREREILKLLADGLSNADIAERVGISEKTVRNHLSHLFDELGVWSRAQAIVFAHEHRFAG